jgi:flagellar P-ring protein precursor FlgI
MELAQKSLLWLISLLCTGVLLFGASAQAAPRIKDIIDVENVRSNQLIGYGLVVGLAGTGDKIRNAPSPRNRCRRCWSGWASTSARRR